MAAIITPRQPSRLRFADSFWDTDDRGVEVVLDKLRNSKQTCEEIKKLYEIRSQIEEDYGERLLKLSQLIVGQAEEGTLAESLSHIPSALETTARAHLDLAQQLKHHLETPLDGFLKEQRDMRRLHHQQIENAKQLKNMHHTNAIKAKEFYTAECTKVAGMEKYLRERGSEMDPDEVHQLKEEIEDGKKMVNAAEQEYKRAIEVLGSVTHDWINSWKTTCDTFQDMEEKRIHYVHGSLRSFSSMMSSVYLVDDQCCERIRTTLELTNTQSDIEEFISRYGTGKEIPVPLQFEPFASMDIQSGQITPASSVHQDLHSVAATTASAKALPPMPESAGQEQLQSVDQQLQDLSVKRKSAEVSEQAEDIPKDQKQQQSDGQDTVITAIQQVEDMLSVEEKPVQQQGDEKPRSVTSTPEDKKPETAIALPQQEQEPAKQPESTTVTTAAVNTNEASASASPDEPPAPTTPPQVESVPQTTEPVKDQADEPKKEASSPPPSSQPVVAAAVVAVPSSEEKPATEESDLRYKPMPNPAFKGTENNESAIPRIDSGSDLNTKGDEQQSKDQSVFTTAAAAASVAIAVATTSINNNNNNTEANTRAAPTATTADQQQSSTVANPLPEIKTTLSDSPAANNDPKKKNDTNEEDGSEKDYPLPPPKAEKWVISSIRRPQQLPVRAQNARMSMFSGASPTPGAPAPDHSIDPTTSAPAPTATTSSGPGNKFSRPNAPFKIEIPNKSQQHPTSQPIQQQPQQVANINNNNSYQGTQAAAQQVIAAGRAHAHQTSSWQSPINSSPNRRYSAADRYHHTERPMPADPVLASNANAAYEDDIGNGREGAMFEQKDGYNSSVGKKNNISSFMKGVLKPSDNSNNNNNPSRPNSEKSNHKASHLQPSSSMSNENKKSKRFSMNVFKKEKKHHKQADDPIYEDTPVVSSSTTPATGNSNITTGAVQAAAPVVVEEPSYGSAPIRPMSTAITPVARPSSAMGSNSARPMSMAYLPQQHQQIQPSPQQQQQTHQEPRLDDGTLVIEYVQALWQYDAKIETEMSFHAGDVFAIIHKQADNWWLAEQLDPRRRQRGLVPGNYMEQVNM
ncbi:hypothetical protein BDA99DRAFT_536142 [Phascolomyces articulosus]|uniref:Cell division control protein n=1 Tax=Phascolomyces articulosus TaxID=60185 RepID=A0AAD5K2W7_9FUNG|nr:hypothetical protein BDA99DRAFT_536142 [Phascolomyces articulosus]